MGSAIELRILGPLELYRDGAEVANLGGPRQRALLAILALDANRVTATEGLVDQLWPGQAPPTAVHTIQVFVSRLRRALGPARDRLVTQRPGYVLELAGDELDATRCEGLYGRGVAALGAGDPERAARLLRDAEALWRGSSLADFTYEPFAQAVIARLDELRLSCREERIEAELELGRHAKVVSELEELLSAHPLRERPRGQLMLALYRSDRQVDALEAFQQARRMLVDELGVEPGERLRRLEQAILCQDLALLPDLPAPAASTPHLAIGSGRAGAAPAPHGDARVLRRTVTVLAGALADRTPPGGGDPELARRLIVLGRREAERIIESHEGLFQAGLGGEVIGVFGLTMAREDDALRALRAADELRARVGALARVEPGSLVIHLGLDTGEVVAEVLDEHASVCGAPVDRGVDLARGAADGEIVLSEVTRRLAPDAIRVRPAGDEAWHLDSIIAGAPAVIRRHDTPMVGRDRELATTLGALARATAARRAELLTVVGDAGVGKSRLAQELCRRVPSATTVLVAQCRVDGDGGSLRPLSEAIVDLAGGDSPAAIRGLLGSAGDGAAVAEILAGEPGLASPAGAGERVPWAFRRLIEVLAEHGPVVLILEDAHWAQAPLLDLVEYLAEWLTSAPVLTLCVARPELLDARPGWGGGRAGVTSIVLTGLADDDARALLDGLARQRPLRKIEAARVLAAAEGNPLFIEQLLAMRTEDVGWDFERRIPATTQALLAARLDRLGPGERAVIECAAVIGRQFWSNAVIELLPPQARPTAEHHLRELVHRGLIEPDRSTLPGEEALRFDHILIRDVAYGACPKFVRADLHESCAQWLAQRGDDHEELVGCHLEQSFGYRRELERLDAAALDLARRAGEQLAAAGRRGQTRGDANSAIGLLGRAAALHEAAGAVRAEVLLGLGRTLADRGDYRAAAPILEAALVAARSEGSEPLVARALIERSNLRLYTDAGDADEMLATAQGAIETFDRSGDEAGLARALSHVGLLHWSRCRCSEMEGILERALSHAERAGDLRERSDILNGLARAAVIGPRPVDDGIRRCREVRAAAGEDVVLAAVSEVMLAVLEAMRGRIDVARELCQGARRQLEDLGLGLRLAGLQMYAAMVELIAGDARLAEPGLVQAYAELDRIDERGRLPTTAAFLARTLCAAGRADEALAFTHIAEERASEHDAATQILWRGTRARVLARIGDRAVALDFARSGVRLAERTDFTYLHGEALADLADVLRALEEPRAAASALDDAITLHDAKQNHASAGRLRAKRRSIEDRSRP